MLQLLPHVNRKVSGGSESIPKPGQKPGNLSHGARSHDHWCQRAGRVLPKRGDGSEFSFLIISCSCSPFPILPWEFIINDTMITICEGYGRLSLSLVH